MRKAQVGKLQPAAACIGRLVTAVAAAATVLSHRDQQFADDGLGLAPQLPRPAPQIVDLSGVRTPRAGRQGLLDQRHDLGTDHHDRGDVEHDRERAGESVETIIEGLPLVAHHGSFRKQRVQPG
jgi:hypothetical protein